MRRVREHLLTGMLTLALLGVGAPAIASPADVRILIDVSGSMKRSDPQNLRRSALALVVRLLPEGARAGVWTFGQNVNMQVRLGEVTPAWRAEAEAGAAAVHSRGLFTNIEEALTRATWDWTRPDPDGRRHVILLTDGVVDVSKDPADSAASRERLVREVLPRLGAAGVRVHAVALSADADHALMRTLAAETDGAYATAHSADELQRIFLHMFERAAPVDALPLTDNAFTVDAEVREMTLLVFSVTDAPPTTLTTPGGESIGAGSKLDQVSWRHEAGYDLVTIQDPAPGEWHIDAAVDPDNRVLVVTDLRLGWEPLPNNAAPLDPLSIRAALTERGAPIDREDFLRMLDVRLTHWAAGAEPAALEVERSPGTARFESTLDGPLTEGAHELVLTVDGGTFSRQLRHVVDVTAPVTVAVTAAPDSGQPAYAITVTPTDGLLVPATLAVQATLSHPDTGSRTLIATAGADGALLIDSGPLAAPGDHALELRVTGRSPAGRAIEMTLPVTKLAGAPPPAAEAAAEPVAEPAADPEPATPKRQVEGLMAIDRSRPPNWILVGGVVGGLNLAVIAGIWLAIRWLRKPAKNPAGDPADDSVEPEDTAVADAAGAPGQPGSESDGPPADGGDVSVPDAA